MLMTRGHLISVATLAFVQTEEQTLDERVGHTFSKPLREGSTYWLCFLLAYQDLDEEFHVVRVCVFVYFVFELFSYKTRLGLWHPEDGSML